MKYRHYTTVAILLLCLMSAMSCSTEKSLAFIEKPIEFVDAETSAVSLHSGGRVKDGCGVPATKRDAVKS